MLTLYRWCVTRKSHEFPLWSKSHLEVKVKNPLVQAITSSWKEGYQNTLAQMLTLYINLVSMSKSHLEVKGKKYQL